MRAARSCEAAPVAVPDFGALTAGEIIDVRLASDPVTGRTELAA